MSTGICPSCNHQNRSDSKFCTQCGHKIRDDDFFGPRLSVLTQEQNKIVFHLKKGHSTIGRDIENSIVINDDKISKFHAIIIYEDDSIWIKDLESKNGVFIGGKKVQDKTELYSGCLIKLGSTMFKFENDTSNSINN